MGRSPLTKGNSAPLTKDGVEKVPAREGGDDAKRLSLVFAPLSGGSGGRGIGGDDALLDGLARDGVSDASGEADRPGGQERTPTQADVNFHGGRGNNSSRGER